MSVEKTFLPWTVSASHFCWSELFTKSKLHTGHEQEKNTSLSGWLLWPNTLASPNTEAEDTYTRKLHSSEARELARTEQGRAGSPRSCLCRGWADVSILAWKSWELAKSLSGSPLVLSLQVAVLCFYSMEASGLILYVGSTDQDKGCQSSLQQTQEPVLTSPVLFSLGQNGHRPNKLYREEIPTFHGKEHQKKFCGHL